MALLRLTGLFAAAVLMLASAASAALTPGQYRAQAKTICAKTVQQTKALGDGKQMSPGQQVQFLAARLGVLKQEYMSLRVLQPPAALDAIHLRILRASYRQLLLDTKAVAKMERGADVTKTLSDEWQSGLDHSGDQAEAWAEAHVVSCERADEFTLVAKPK